MYKKELYRIGSVGVKRCEFLGMHIWDCDRKGLVEMCRRHGLKASGTKSELLYRMRDHKRDALRRQLDRSFLFWVPIVR